jgi:sugar lactone lactonase YvrE
MVRKVLARMVRRTLLGSAAFLVSIGSSEAGSLYVASGSEVQAFDAATGVAGGLFQTPTGGWSNAFSLVVDSSGQIYVGDAGANRIIRYGTDLQVNGTFAITVDTSPQNISPQQIALDSSGNLYTTSFGGDVYKFSSTGAGTIGATAARIQTISPNARGLLVNGTEAYVTTSGYGTASVVKFDPSTVDSAQTPIYSTFSGEQGQLRGMALNSTRLLVADSTWTENGGYIEEMLNNGTSPSVFISGSENGGLLGPNSLAFGSSSALYISEYYGNRITKYSSTGFFQSNFITTGTLRPTGIAFSPGTVANGLPQINAMAPSFFQAVTVAEESPEPGTWLLLGSALLVIFGAKSWTAKYRSVA